MVPSASEDLHAWSIYRQNLNSDFTDSALGSSEKSPLPYGNFQLRESTVQSILSHPRYGPKSPLGSNMYTYLKFGLPRVFPPNGGGPRNPRDGSSGYDSSEDGGTTSRNDKRTTNYYLRTQSNPDFRNIPYHQPTLPRAPGMAGGRGKSISEANLLSAEALMRSPAPPEHRRSIHDLRHPSLLMPHQHPYNEIGSPAHLLMHHHKGGRPASVAVVGRPSSVLSIPLTHREPTTLSFQVNRGELYNGQYPHLQVRGMDVEGQKKEPLLQGVSFEVRGGEILAVMATTAPEGKALLDGLMGHANARIAHIILNGQKLTQSSLQRRAAYVRADFVLAPNLSVAQTLAFYSILRRPPYINVQKVSVQEQMGLLIEELGLAQVLDTKVSSLTASELQRLNLACHLIANTEILLLDRPTAHMDIFDTFFLVEFLRQWAGGGTGGLSGRIVILTLQPPTYEIFTMVSRVVLLSSGRLMYSGRRRDMLPYFSTADYPCPAYKNPSDYYLDLVTLDDLSAEAMLESSQRIEQLAELFRRRQEPLSDPGPPQALPGKTRPANIFKQFIAILLRQTVYCQPSSLCRWISHLLLACTLSLIVGAVFWDLPSSDPLLLQADRLGYHYTMLCVVGAALLPVVAIARTHDMDRLAAESDVKDNLYSRTLYIIVATLVSVPPSLLLWLGFIIPAYAMTGLYNQGPAPDGFYVYIGYMLVALCTLQSLTTLLGYLCPGRLSASLLSCLLILCLSLVSGFPVLRWDLPPLSPHLAVLSPARWILAPLAGREYAQEAVIASSAQHICKKNQVQRQDIIVQLPCPSPNGSAALAYHGLQLPDSLPLPLAYSPYLPPLMLAVVCLLLIPMAYVCSGRCYTLRRRQRSKY
ncbi:ATP-binding cassette sub-family G member 8-like [Macrosteles quadrilineatus]|uniref:ATP-binding cassette sub-family G member 8-like n=1 Tax=Macrosteles quadrilineatus TaxID=74068 RepID=UPI0023E2E149|nr:ATP-binding cassette sub-family G member 8-like [Macrosteles quadrilineatus]